MNSSMSVRMFSIGSSLHILCMFGTSLRYYVVGANESKTPREVDLVIKCQLLATQLREIGRYGPPMRKRMSANYIDLVHEGISLAMSYGNVWRDEKGYQLLCFARNEVLNNRGVELTFDVLLLSPFGDAIVSGD